MSLPQCQELLLELRDSVLFITLNRPHKRNAMNIELVQELMAVLDAIASQREVRAVVLRGAEGNFCAGGDIAGMSKTGLDQSALERATWESNRIFGRMLTRANRAPVSVILPLQIVMPNSRCRKPAWVSFQPR
jgi:isohexenylglutaconyl-CoA hydratase